MDLLRILLGDVIFLPDGSTISGNEISGYEGSVTGKDRSGNLITRNASGDLMTVRSLPASGTQLHILSMI